MVFYGYPRNKLFGMRSGVFQALASSIVSMSEWLSLLIASIVIALVFGSGVLLRGDLISFTIVTLGAILAVIPHELMHRWSARRLGCYSRYVLYPMGLLLTLATAVPFIPFKIILPGFVVISCGVISGRRAKWIDGVTSFAGPVTNIFLSAISLTLLKILLQAPLVYYYSGWFRLLLAFLGFSALLNAWVGFFNLLPVPPLDGSKIIRWKPLLWLLSFVISIILLIATGFSF